MSNFNINATYGNLSKLFSCSSRREFGSKVTKFFGIDKSEIQFLEISRNSRNPITLNELKDNMKVEVRKNAILTSKTNGECSTSTSRKRKRGPDEDDPPKEMVNRKVQVDVGGVVKHSSYTQTDPLLNYDPDKPSTSKDLISESKRLARSEKKDKVKIRQLMDETFETRRQFILLKNPILILVKEKYPLLFSSEEVRNELNRIFYDKKDEEFLSNIKNCSPAILSLVYDDNPLKKIIKDAVDAAKTPNKKSYAEEVGALLMISNILHEKRTYLDTEDEPCEKNNYPRIEAACEVCELFKDRNTYRIIVEGILFCEADTFPEAVLCLLACYFIFNISYPERSFNTFVVMEKLFLDANDTDGSEIDEQTSQIIRLIKLKTNPKT